MLKRSLIIIIAILLTLTQVSEVNAQGCVAIRGFSCTGGLGNRTSLMKGEFQVSAGYRYFKSYKHFRGSHEEAERVENGTEVINKSNFLDISVSYGITDRLYGNVIIPFLYHDRSSMYEHGGNPPSGLGDRRSTNSKGLSDVRIGVGYWLIDPVKQKPYNFALGLGLKLPTGDYNYKDTFYNQGADKDETVYAVVDQSIQPGDGGLGIALDFQGFYALSDQFVLSTNMYYLINPKQDNGIYTRNSTTNKFACADQMAARLGVFYNIKSSGLSLYLGGRMEGVPSDDLVGSSDAYRRPGYAVSIEPGLSYGHGNFNINLSVPVAMYRNRVQSFSDKQKTRDSVLPENGGVYKFSNGDAAFADYLLNLTLSFRIGKKHENMVTPTDINLN